VKTITEAFAETRLKAGGKPAEKSSNPLHTVLKTAPQVAEIKQIPITTVLAARGIAHTHNHGAEFYYISPLTSEKTASFTVNTDKNVWYCHATGQGGDVIQFFMAYFGTDFDAALVLLAHFKGSEPVQQLQAASFEPAATEQKEANIRIDSVVGVSHRALISYLEQKRGLNWGLIRQSNKHLAKLKQVHYTSLTNNKQYFSLGWLNEANGVDLRSENFKSKLGNSTYTFLPGTKGPKYEGHVAVFEGFINYFSALTHYKRPTLHYDVIVLNSGNNIDKALDLLRGYKTIHSFHDRDAAGRKLFSRIQEECQAKADVRDMSHNYTGYNDFNDMLLKKPQDKEKEADHNRTQTAKWWLWLGFRKEETTKSGLKTKQLTFFCETDDREGMAGLKDLRQHIMGTNPNLYISRICERVPPGEEHRHAPRDLHGEDGRKYLILEELEHNRW
jgi:hypothetical protein